MSIVGFGDFEKNLLMLVAGTWVLQVGQLGKLAICARVAKAARWPNLQITKNKLMNDFKVRLLSRRFFSRLEAKGTKEAGGVPEIGETGGPPVVEEFIIR